MSLFGSQAGSSMFGGMSTGIFDTGASMPVSTASSVPVVGCSMPAFGASSSPAVDASSFSFAGSSTVWPKPSSGGGFGSTVQSSPFGISFQQQSETANGASRTPAFGVSSTSAFAATSTPAFGNTGSAFGTSVNDLSTPAFGASSTLPFAASSTPAFDASSAPGSGASSTPPLAGSSLVWSKPSSGGGFGSTTQSSPFGSSFQQQSQPDFGASSTPVFGVSNASVSGATSTSAFGGSSTPAFGNTGSAFGTPVFGSSTPDFGASSSPSFGAASTPAFGASRTPTFGNTGSAFGTSVIGSSTPDFCASSSPSFGASSTPAFGASSTPVFWWPPTKQFRSSPVGPQMSGPSFWSHGFGQPSFRGQLREGTRVATYAQTYDYDNNPIVKLKSISAMPAYKQKSLEELRWEDYKLGDKGNALFHYPPEFLKAALCYSAFGAAFVSTSLFGSATSSWPFGRPTSSAFGTAMPIFGTQAQGTTSSFGTGFDNGSTQSSPLFQSFTPTPGQATRFYGQSTPPVCGNLHLSTPSFLSTSSMGVDQKTPSSPFPGEPVQFHIQQNAPFGQTTLASGQSNALGENIFSSTPSLLISTSSMGFNQKTPSLSMPFQSTQPTQNTGGFSFAPQTVSGDTSNIYGQDICQQSFRSQGQTLSQQSIMSPFGILPAKPVDDKPSPTRKSCLLNSQKQIAKKYRHKKKVSFSDENLTASKTPAFDQPSFGGQQRVGTRITLYAQTIEADGGQLMSISAMCAYKEKNHEELRWEDYQVGDKGNMHCGFYMNNIQQPNPFVPTSIFVFGTQAQVTSSSFPLFQSTAPTFGQTSSPFGQHVLVIHQHFYTNHKDSA